MITLLLFDIPLPRTPTNICINFILPEPEFLGYILATNSMGISHSVLLGWANVWWLTPVPSYQLNNLSVISLCCKIMLKICSEESFIFKIGVNATTCRELVEQSNLWLSWCMQCSLHQADLRQLSLLQCRFLVHHLQACSPTQLVPVLTQTDNALQHQRDTSMLVPGCGIAFQLVIGQWTLAMNTKRLLKTYLFRHWDCGAL